jgi:hypothetical protein
MDGEGLLAIDRVVFVFVSNRPQASEILTFDSREEALAYCTKVAKEKGYSEISAPLRLHLAAIAPVILSFQPPLP